MSTPRFILCSKASGVVVRGFVLGISNIPVIPPNAADIVPVWIVSLCSPPGSLKWHWVSIKPGKIKRSEQSKELFESQSKNRGRAEKSRLKKEGVITENPAAIAAGVRAAMARAKEKELSAGGGKKVKVATALSNKSHPQHKQAKGIIQRIKDKAKSMLAKSKKKKAEPKKQTKSDADFYARQFGGKVESVNEANNIDKIKDIVKKKQYKRIGGVIIKAPFKNL